MQSPYLVILKGCSSLFRIQPLAILIAKLPLDLLLFRLDLTPAIKVIKKHTIDTSKVLVPIRPARKDFLFTGKDVTKFLDNFNR